MAAQVETALPDILSSFTSATSSAVSALPTPESIIPPENGITLLDAKNEIFISYLQALALRNLHIVQSLKEGKSVEDAQDLNDRITKKLIELRVYLERGVRPLEGKIKWQVERVIKAAEDEERAKTAKNRNVGKGKGLVNGRKDESGSEDEEDDEDSDESADESLARPNASSLNAATGRTVEADRRARSKEDGVYRPPRISATTMPTNTTSAREEKQRRPPRSRTLDEYVANELSTAPAAEPSIGSTIAAGGRRDKDARQLAKEAERRNYEETNLIRLPKESKRELAKQRGSRDRQREGGGFGGEEWRGLGESVDRISEVTRRKGGRESVLDRSRKRKGGDVDGQVGNGMGDAFEKKRRKMMKRKR